MNDFVVKEIRCPKCGQTKTEDNFSLSSNRPNGHSCYCRDCDKIRNSVPIRLQQKKEYYQKNREILKKKRQEYYQKNRDGILEQQNFQYKNSQDFRQQKKKSHVKRRFGLTLEEYEKVYKKFFVLQNGCCGICNKHQSELSKPLVLDHCHKTGKFRGLLCFACNVSIGGLQDDAELCLKAYNYLRKS